MTSLLGLLMHTLIISRTLNLTIDLLLCSHIAEYFCHVSLYNTYAKTEKIEMQKYLHLKDIIYIKESKNNSSSRFLLMLLLNCRDELCHY